MIPKMKGSNWYWDRGR